MIETSIRMLRAARSSRARARDARDLARADATRPTKEQLRLYAKRLEQAASTIERTVIATRPHTGHA